MHEGSWVNGSFWRSIDIYMATSPLVRREGVIPGRGRCPRRPSLLVFIHRPLLFICLEFPSAESDHPLKISSWSFSISVDLSPPPLPREPSVSVELAAFPAIEGFDLS